MSGISGAPGFSMKAQMREAKAQLRRALRLEIRSLEDKLREKKDELAKLELEKQGQAMLRRQQQILPGGPAKE